MIRVRRDKLENGKFYKLINKKDHEIYIFKVIDNTLSKSYRCRRNSLKKVSIYTQTYKGEVIHTLRNVQHLTLVKGDRIYRLQEETVFLEVL